MDSVYRQFLCFSSVSNVFCVLSIGGCLAVSLAKHNSDVQADNLRGRYLQLLVDTSLQVLVQQSFQFFVLLVKQSGLLDEVLPLHKLLVVFAEG
jgi:hypothetical protein